MPFVILEGAGNAVLPLNYLRKKCPNVVGGNADSFLEGSSKDSEVTRDRKSFRIGKVDIYNHSIYIYSCCLLFHKKKWTKSTKLSHFTLDNVFFW